MTALVLTVLWHTCEWCILWLVAAVPLGILVGNVMRRHLP